MEKKLTDEEIEKALEACMSGKGCEACPYFENGIDCVRRSEKDTLDLIHRLQDENKRLTEEVQAWKDGDVKKNAFHLHIVENEKKLTRMNTASDALEQFIVKLINLRLVRTESDMYHEMIEAKDDLLKERYGVEVDE